METENVSPKEIEAYLKERNLSASWLAYTLGVTKATTGRWLNQQTPIPETVDKLLRMLIRGENPFRGDSPETAPGILKFTGFEWRLFDVMRTREGFPCVEDWIVDKIRIYMGMSGAAKNVAESIRGTPEAEAASQPRKPVKYPTAKDRKAASTSASAATAAMKTPGAKENIKRPTTMLRALPSAPKAKDKKA